MTNLKLARRQQGLTQKELSELSGVPRISIARYESGVVTPGGANLVKLSEALKVSAEYLMEGSVKKCLTYYRQQT